MSYSLKAWCASFQGCRSFQVELAGTAAGYRSCISEEISNCFPFGSVKIPVWELKCGFWNSIHDLRGVGLLPGTCDGSDLFVLGDDDTERSDSTDWSSPSVSFNEMKSMSRRTMDEFDCKDIGWSCVRANRFLSTALQMLVALCILVIAITGVAAFEHLRLESGFLRNQQIRRLYFWPSTESNQSCKFCLRLCCACLLCLLEMAEDDPSYDLALGGVHILQCYFRIVLFLLVVFEILWYLRIREEHTPKFPSRCLFHAGSRFGRHPRHIGTKKKLIAMVLLFNLVSAEAVSLASEVRRASLPGLTEEHAAEHQDAGQHMPEAERISTDSSSLVDTGGRESGESVPILTSRLSRPNDNLAPHVRLCDVLTTPCVPGGNQTTLGTVHEFCPHFGTGLDNLVSSHLSGEHPILLADTYVHGSFREHDVHAYAEKETGWTAVVWYASFPGCISESRQLHYPDQELRLLREDFNQLWAAECKMLCDYALVRPQPPGSDFLVNLKARHFLVWRQTLPTLRAVLFRLGPDLTVSHSISLRYEACSLFPLRRRGFERSWHACSSDGGRSIIWQDHDRPLSQGQLLEIDYSSAGARPNQHVFPREDAMHDALLLMQIGPPIEDAIGRHIRLNALNHRNTQIIAWFHPVDARGRLSGLFRLEWYNHELPAGPQVRSFWASAVGRRQCFVYIVQPIPHSLPERVPHFILTTFQTSTIFPILLDYYSEDEQFRATFLLYFTGYADVNGIFMQVYPMNQCVWQNDCTVRLDSGTGVQLYEWGQVVPIFRGAYIVLTEATRRSDGSESTCSSADNGDSDATDTDGSYRSGHYIEAVNHAEVDDIALMQGSISPRGNTATLEASGSILDEHFAEGALASFSLLHLEDSVAVYVYRVFQRPLHELRVVQSWVVTYVHQLGYVPRFTQLDAGSSLTESLLHLWQDLVPDEDIGFSSERYPTLRITDANVASLLGAPMSKLRLGFRAYLVTGWPDPIPYTVALLSNGQESADEIILRVGYGARCMERLCFLYQDRGGLNPIWKGADVVSEPHGSHFSLLVQTDDECHQMTTIDTPQQQAEIDETDMFSGMQTSWKAAFEAEETEFRRQLGLRPDALARHILWPHNGQIQVGFDGGHQGDVLKNYLLTLRPMHLFPVHSVTTWMGKGQVVLTFRRCAYTGKRSFTDAFLQEWSDLEDEGPFLVALVHPEVPPLSLKVSSLDLMCLTRKQHLENKRLYLFDILFKGIPRRSAVQSETGDTLFMLVRKLGLCHLCGPGKYWCILKQYENDREWNLHDVIEEPHATSFKLIFRDYPQEECTGSHASYEIHVDQTSLMQRIAEPSQALRRYIMQFFRSSGTLTFWVHHDSEHIVQQHSMICSFTHVDEVNQQCSDIWSQEGRIERFELVPIEPAPIFIAIPRPHVLVVGGGLNDKVPVLCRVRELGRYNLLSFLVSYQFPPVGVASIFQIAIPQNDCEHRTLCSALYEGERYMFHHDIQLHRGGYVQLFEDERATDVSDTTCGEGTSFEQSPHSDRWSSRFSLDDEDDHPTDLGSEDEGDTSSLMQSCAQEEEDHSEGPATLSTRRADTESLCDDYAHGGPIEIAPHFTNQCQQIEALRLWLVDLLYDQDAITLFVFEGLGTDVVTHQVAFTREDLHAREGFLLWLRRELRSLWQGPARIFPLQAAPFVDLRIAVLLPHAFGRELPVLLEIRMEQETWREIQVATQARTINSFIWRSSLPNVVPETMRYQVMLCGEEAEPGDLVPWEPGQWLSITVGPLEAIGGEATTVSFVDPQIASLSSCLTSLATSLSSSRRLIGGSCSTPQQEDSLNGPPEDDAAALFQAKVATTLHSRIRRPTGFLEQHERLDLERERFLDRRRKVDQTRLTTFFHQYESFSSETIAFWAAKGRWPDFVLYSTRNDKVSHWGLAVDEFFVLERYDFAAIVRDYLRSAIPFTVKAILMPVKPLPDVSEQQGEDDLFLLIDEEPEEGAVPVFVSLWIREADRPPELYAQRLPQLVHSSTLLQSYGLEEVCSHHMYNCFVSHFGQELPTLVPWRPFRGMKIDVRVDVLGYEHCELEESDEESLFQKFAEAAMGPARCCPMEEYPDCFCINLPQVVKAETVDSISLMQTALRRVPRASDLDPMLPLRSVHTWHGSFVVPNPHKDQVRIGIRMTMPGSLEMLASFEFLCWGVRSGTSQSSDKRQILLHEGRWDEQFLRAAVDMGISMPIRLVLVASQPPGRAKHMLAMTDDLFHGGVRFFLMTRPFVTADPLVVVPCPESCSYDSLESSMGLGAICETQICLLRCTVPRGPSTYVSGQLVTMPTGTPCQFEFLRPEEVACAVMPVQLLQYSVVVERRHTKNYDYCRGPRCGLPPPGNPLQTSNLEVFWNSSDFHKLDDWSRRGKTIYVFDYPIVQLKLCDWLPCRHDSKLTLADKVIDRTIQMPDFSPLHQRLCMPWSQAEIKWLPFFEQLSKDLQDEAMQLVFDWPTHLDFLEIYTDGSFQSGSPENLAGWSFLVLGYLENETFILDLDWGLVQTDPMDPTWTGAESSTAKSAEGAALIRALEWLFAHPQTYDCRLRFDSMLAGFSGSGEYNISLHDRQFRLLRALAQACDSYRDNRAPLCWEHIKGHAGHLGNELADLFAKRAFQEQKELRDQIRPDYTPYIFGERFPIESFWLFYQKLPSGMRILQDEQLRLPGVHIGGAAQDRLPAEIVCPPVKTAKQKRLHIFLATYNVMTLGTQAGNLFVQYLREQAHAHCLDVLFLQETRSKKDQLVISATHFRYAAAAKDGVGGVEIWLAREQASTGKTSFSKAATQVLHADPQCLLLKTLYHGVDLLLLTFHAPHSGKDHAVISEFWQALTARVKLHFSKFPNLLVGADANAHFATELEGHIGDAGLEHTTDFGGDCFRRFLLDFDLFVPSTYDHIHRGGHHTWWSFSAGKGARCDYFAVPRAWQSAFFETQVRTSLDEGKAGIDHLPLTLYCKVWFQTARAGQAMPQFDRKSLQNATQKHLTEVLKDLKLPQWHVGIDQHAMQLSAQISQRLCEHFPQKRGPRRSYISEETWQIRSRRLGLRRQAFQSKQKADSLSVRLAFMCLRNSCGFNFFYCLVRGLKLCAEIQQQRSQTAETTKLLKKNLRADRTASLENLARSEPQMSQRDFAQALQSLGVRNSKKPSGIQPLPMIQAEDGKTVDTLEDLMTCWREYFGEQEDGIEVTPEELLRQSDSRWAEQSVTPPWDFLPTLSQIERQFRKCKPGKSYFLDGIPGEVLHKAPALMAAAFFSLYCKQVAFVREPVIFKGGFLTPAFKKGSPKLIQNYRSLFVSSMTGKALHSIYRGDLVKAFDAQRMQLQVGGIPGQGTTQPVHALRLYQLQAIRAGRSSAIVFVDISNAFYRLLRQHIVQVKGETRPVQELFHRLGLPPESFEEFRTLFERPPAIEEAQVSAHMQALFQEFFESTWFKLRDDNHLVQTRRGSRPGDSFADLCFSFALVKIVRAAIQSIALEHPDICLAWNNKFDPLPSDEVCTWLDPVMPIWADDLAIAFDDTTAEGLLCKCEQIVAKLFDSLQNAGLRPNLKPGKSEILIDLRGKGALRCRRQLVFQGHQILIPSTVNPFQISVVGAYRHLGTWIQVGGGISRELKVKFAIAHDAMTKYRSQIFANKAMTLTRKRQFFDSLVLSVILYNSAVWVPRNKRQATQLEAAFHRLYQRFAVLHYGANALTWSHRWLLYKLSLPEAAIVLAVSRLRYLGQLVPSGQPVLWALLQRDAQWLLTLQADLATLEHYCPEIGCFAPLSYRWQDLAEFIVASPARWKRSLRKLQARAISMQALDTEWMQWHNDIRE